VTACDMWQKYRSMAVKKSSRVGMWLFIKNALENAIEHHKAQSYLMCIVLREYNNACLWTCPLALELLTLDHRLHVCNAQSAINQTCSLWLSSLFLSLCLSYVSVCLCPLSFVTLPKSEGTAKLSSVVGFLNSLSSLKDPQKIPKRKRVI
jgi:hypothetical protein